MKPSGSLLLLRRGALLVAALLHLLGTAAGPALHGWLRPDPHAPGWTAERAHLSAPHDELACGICQAGAGPALPGEPLHAPAEAPRAARPRVLAHLLAPSPRLSRPGARAPPAVFA